MYDKKTITKDTLERHLAEGAVYLLNMARDSAWNQISDNCLFILSNATEQGNTSFSPPANKRKLHYSKKTPKQLEDIMPLLLALYSDIYEIDLIIYKASKGVTIIEIWYELKSLLPDFIKSAEGTPPMFHLKIPTPRYNRINFWDHVEPTLYRKFDINWRNNTMSHRLNLFLWHLRYKADKIMLKMGYKPKRYVDAARRSYQSNLQKL